MRMVSIALYRPPSTTLELIRSLLDLDFLVVLWMNSIEELPTHSNLVCLGSGKNVGLSIAFNGFFDYALVRGINAFLFLDQDALVFRSIVQDFDKVMALKSFEDHAAVQLKDNAFGADLLTEKIVFSNGCVFNVECPVRHSKDFFVEGVDYDFCLNAALLDYSIGVVSSNSLVHEVMQPRTTYYINGSTFAHRPYPVRRQIEFLYALQKLALRSLIARRLDFFIIFNRNIFTHLAVQCRAGIFFALWRMRLIIRKDENF